MSDTLLERLRFNADWGIPDFTNKQLLDEAAARIEELEADVAKWEKFSAALLDAKNKRIETLEASLAEWKALAVQWAKDNEAAPEPEK